MRILIDIGHPAHVHYFKNLSYYFLAKNNNVLFTYREKEVTKDLLDYYNFRGINFGRPYKSILGKIWGLFFFTLRELVVSIKFKPDILLNGTMYCAIVSKIIGKPHFSLEDTFNMEQVKIFLPFTSVVLTGAYKHPPLGRKEIKYNGYQELAYLHPKYFKPDENILKELGVKENEKYVIIRFVSWQASHDRGHEGISLKNKISAVREFEKYAKVFISSEAVLPHELNSYKIKITPDRMHDAIAFASLVIGESFTMLSEAAILATPAILIHNTKCYYLTEQQEKYGLTFNYTESEEDQIKAIEKGVKLLKTQGIKEEWQKRREKLLADKIDVTAFLIWFVENYPNSFRIMKENPDYQYNFK